MATFSIVEDLDLLEDFRSRLIPSLIVAIVDQVVLQTTEKAFGHGVGMCQFCTQGMAQRGDHWRDMLAAFYPSYELRRVY